MNVTSFDEVLPWKSKHPGCPVIARTYAARGVEMALNKSAQETVVRIRKDISAELAFENYSRELALEFLQEVEDGVADTIKAIRDSIDSEPEAWGQPQKEG